MQLVLINVTKIKEAIHNSGTVANAFSTNVSIVLTELVYLQKMDQTSPSWVFH
jgi:hypothetical protein